MRHLGIQKLDPEAITPTYATPGSACFDLYACLPQGIEIVLDDVGMLTSVIIPTGLAVEIPPGEVLMLFSRSGHGFKNSVRLANCVGIIDSDYRGQVMVKLQRDDTVSPNLTIKHGDRIAQGMLMPVSPVVFDVKESLSATERGAGGMGSTGA